MIDSDVYGQEIHHFEVCHNGQGANVDGAEQSDRKSCSFPLLFGILEKCLSVAEHQIVDTADGLGKSLTYPCTKRNKFGSFKNAVFRVVSDFAHSSPQEKSSSCVLNQIHRL